MSMHILRYSNIITYTPKFTFANDAANRYLRHHVQKSVSSHPDVNTESEHSEYCHPIKSIPKGPFCNLNAVTCVRMVKT